MGVNKYLFIFLALVACQRHEFIVAHGRKVKAMNQHSSPNTNSNTNTSVAKSTHLRSLESSVNSPEQHYEEASSVGDSVTNYDNAFRPTTPGGSPGVGHRIITSSEDHNVKTIVAVQSPRSPLVEVSVTKDSKDDFKPTDPGHSPGVGHAYPNKIGQTN
ncbi:hypothetical protein Fmac_014785 [Flemingia macrophylla]|uniref:Precursor of CEP9 n=1 Tax=Flemingia macrophylla TaxID=520843 RepID=A0ABD1MD82_9FABA